MMLQKITGLIVFFAFSLLISFSALAADTAPDMRRASLVTFWEEKIKSDTQVQKFEKTDVEGVYNFSTTYFPYTGRLKLLNAAITGQTTEYSSLPTGIIEVELMDVTPDFFTKYAKSYSAWNSSQYYYYDTTQNVWFSPSEWAQHQPTSTVAEESGPQCGLSALGAAMARAVLWSVAILLLIIFIIAIGISARKQNKRVWSRNDEIFENQKISIKNSERMLAVMEEQSKLLQKISETLERK